MRKTGATTIQVDRIIQELFTSFGQWVLVEDFYKEDEQQENKETKYHLDIMVSKKVVKRLSNEHTITLKGSARNAKVEVKVITDVRGYFKTYRQFERYINDRDFQTNSMKFVIMRLI